MSTHRSSKLIHKKHKKYVPRKHRQPAVVVFNPSNKTFICLICRDKLHDQIPKEWGIWEIPRHLEKAHNLPKEAYDLRMKLIQNWNSDFEKEYRRNLEKGFIYNFENQNAGIAVDNLSRKWKKEDKEDRRLDLEANRESD